MVATHQPLAYRQQGCSHPLLHRETKQAEAAAPGRCAAVGEAQKVEVLRPWLPLFASLPRSESTKTYQSGLTRVQIQTELRQTRLQFMQEAFGCRLPFKAEHTVIRVANQDDVSIGLDRNKKGAHMTPLLLIQTTSFKPQPD